MPANANPNAVARLLCVLLALMMLSACRATPRVDWDSRVGHYTYDHAVAELGPPDKTATLSDGSMVADWVQRGRGGGVSFGVGTGMMTGRTGVGVGVGQTVGTRPGDRVLRLSFGPDNVLRSWTKNY
jgi:hypothetical protein